MIDGLRIGFMVVWGITLIVLFPSAFRCFFRQGLYRDRQREAVWWTATVLFGFALRWVLYPVPAGFVMGEDEAALWAGLYAAGMLAGVRLTLAVWSDGD